MVRAGWKVEEEQESDISAQATEVVDLEQDMLRFRLYNFHGIY